MVKFGNVASEHAKSAISEVLPQLSAEQQNPSAKQPNRVGALVTHHPAWMSHTDRSRQGHPRYTGAQQWEGRGWPDQEISQSAAHRHETKKKGQTEKKEKEQKQRKKRKREREKNRRKKEKRNKEKRTNRKKEKEQKQRKKKFKKV